jgi:hypothetical protein
MLYLFKIQLAAHRPLCYALDCCCSHLCNVTGPASRRLPVSLLAFSFPAGMLSNSLAACAISPVESWFLGGTLVYQGGEHAEGWKCTY